jgi:hypothetical protein
MRLKLNQILESTILLEGRKEDAIKKYGEEHKELIEMLSNADPSGNNKYLDWMIKTSLGFKRYTTTPTADNVLRTVSEFHRLLSGIRQKDINSYKTLLDLNQAVIEAKSKEEEKKVAKQAKKVYEDDTAVIYAPFTVQASCKYGAGSKWCIAGTSGGDNYNTHFDSYSKHSNFYFFINKQMSKNTNPKDYKYALQWKFDDGDSLTWWDAEDISHRNPPSWVTDEMMQAVRDFQPTHKKIKLGAQLKAFIDTPRVSEYPKFRSMLEPNQVTQVINKIIEAGDLTSDTFVKLSQDLTDEQKDKFINEYVRGKITINDFKKMSNNLNKEQKKLSIKHNNTLLNDYELMTEISEEFSEEELYQLSKVIDGKNISNSNSKVLLRKWSMSPEELKKHRENSFYVFLSTEEEYVEQLYKVDPLDPDSYVTINMLKLKKQVRSNVKMFGIKISSSVLDKYVGKSSSSMSPDIIETIKKTANQI